jgi:hypothetical protein
MQDGPLRYVVLRHEGVARPHFDVMWESRPGSRLVTIRTDQWPMPDPMRFERLEDHRREYLDYEGPVSGGRGHVRRIASGTCTFEANLDDSIIVRFDSGLTFQMPRARSD